MTGVPTAAGEQAPTDAVLLEGTRRALAHRTAVAQRDGRAPSVVTGVVRDGRLAWSGAAGAVDGPPSDVGYRIGSITKTFTAVLVLQLRDEGRLRLTDRLDDHLPGLGGDSTLQQLLSHTGGFTSERPGPWWERVDGGDAADLVAALRDEPSRVTPGSRLHYSNVGFALLGQVVARLGGAGWAEQLRTRILEPLGMTRTTLAPAPPVATGWAVHPHADVLLPEPATETGAMAPAGQLWSTLADLARWSRFLAGDTADVLSGATWEEMTQPASVDDAPAWTSGFGLGLQLRRVDGRRLVGHGGSMPGFVSAVWSEPATGDGAVVLTNATSGVAVGATCDDLLRILAGEPGWPRPWAPAPVASSVLELTGSWYWGTSSFTLSVEGQDQLRLTAAGGGRSSRFRPDGPDRWTGCDNYYAGERLEVVRRPDGTASHLDVATFVLTRQPYGSPGVTPGGVDPLGWRGPDA